MLEDQQSRYYYCSVYSPEKASPEEESEVDHESLLKWWKAISAGIILQLSPQIVHDIL
jgi:hypothetical protein